MNDPVEAARQLPPPSVKDIIGELDNPTGTITYCVDHTGQRRNPPELWIAALHTWLKCDGSERTTALQGKETYHGLNRQRIAQAVRRWRRHNP
jgi:hypothetical protein